MKWTQLTFSFNFKPLKKLSTSFKKISDLLLDTKEFYKIQDKKDNERKEAIQNSINGVKQSIDKITSCYSNMRKVLTLMPTA